MGTPLGGQHRHRQGGVEIRHRAALDRRRARYSRRPGVLRRGQRVIALGRLCACLPAAHADLAAGRRKAEACAACHGADGNSVIAQFPVLAGQTARYLYLQLKDFKESRRSEPTMAPTVAKLSTQDMLDLSEYFAAQKARPIA